MKKLIFGLLLALTATFSVNAQAVMNHTTVDNSIDGSKNPELISDSSAYYAYLLTLSVPANATSEQQNVQNIHLSKVGLTAGDLAALKITIASFRSQYDVWVAKWNAQATVQGESFDSTNLLTQLDSLVQNTRDILTRSMSATGSSKLYNHIQGEKRFMRVPAN